MKTMLAEAADWHEAQATAHHGSEAVLKRFDVPGWEYHTAMVKLHRQFAVAIREADSDEPQSVEKPKPCRECNGKGCVPLPPTYPPRATEYCFSECPKCHGTGIDQACIEATRDVNVARNQRLAGRA